MSEIIYMAWLPALAEFVLLLGDRLDYDFIETDGRYNTWRVMPKKEVSLKSHWEPFAGWQMEPEAMSEPVVIVLRPWSKFSIWVGWSDKEQTIAWCEHNPKMIAT